MNKMMKVFFKINFTLILSMLLFISCGSNSDSNKMIANAGNDIFIVSPKIVLLDGSKSISSNTDLKYSWELYYKPNKSKATLSNSKISNPTLFVDVEGDYFFKLTISDGKKTAKDEVKITLNSLCKISSDVKFNTLASKETFNPQIEGVKNDINSTFVYFNHIKNAISYKISINTKTKKWINSSARNNIIFQFKNDKSVKANYIASRPHDYMNDALVLRSSNFNIGDKIQVSLKAFDVNDNLITSSKEVSFIIGEAYHKDTLKVYFNNTSLDDKINLSWCPANNDKEYILHYGNSFNNLDKTIQIKNSLDLKTSIEYINKENTQYFTLSNNGIFSNTINTIPLSNTDNINFAISKVTFNQSVQVDMDNNINNTPIIANKSGILRVFTTVSNGFSTYKVKVKLSGKNNDKKLSPIIKTVLLYNNDFNTTDSTNKPITFHINNPDWLKVGTEFYIEIDIDDEIKESNENDNRYPKELYKSFDFQDVSIMKVRLIPIHGILGYVNIPTTYITEIKNVLESMYPLSAIDIDIDKPMNLVHSTIDTVTELLDMLENVIKYKDEKIIEDRKNQDVYYVGIVDNLRFLGFAGLGTINDNQDISLTSITKINNITMQSFVKTIIHEIGHNHSLRHIDNSDEKSCAIPKGVDANYPYNKVGASFGRIGKTSYAYNRNILYNKNLYHDIMTYCLENSWISDYSYNKIYNFERKLDKLYTRNIKRSITNNKNINSLINGRIIMGRLDNNIWSITKNYLSKGRENIPKIKTNLYLQVIFQDNTKAKIPFYLKDISHIKLKIFKIFIPSAKDIKSLEVIDAFKLY